VRCPLIATTAIVAVIVINQGAAMSDARLAHSVTVRFDEPLWQRIEAMARADRRSVGAWLRLLVSDVVAGRADVVGAAHG